LGIRRIIEAPSEEGKDSLCRISSCKGKNVC
jgi:hypothetical protein